MPELLFMHRFMMHPVYADLTGFLQMRNMPVFP